MIKWATLANPNCLVSSDGRVFSVRQDLGHCARKLVFCASMKELPVHITHGYAYVTIGKKSYRAHKLIAEAFLGICPEGKVVDHINRNRADNRLENLRYVTFTENNLNRSRKGNITERGLFRTVRVIDGKRVHVIIPLSERRNKCSFQ